MKSLKRNYKKQVSGIIEFMDSGHPVVNDKSIHTLRLNIKKIRAFLELAAFVNKDFKAGKGYKAFKKIFKAAGNIRMTQVEIHKVGNYGFSEGKVYLKYLQDRLGEQKTLFLKMDHQAQKRKIFKQIDTVAGALDPITRDQVQNFLDDRRKDLGKLLKRQLFHEISLHVIRKKVKRIFLTMKLVASKMDKESAAQLEIFDEFQDLLGKWHDLQVATDHLATVIGTDALKGLEPKMGKALQRIVDKKAQLFIAVVRSGGELASRILLEERR